MTVLTGKATGEVVFVPQIPLIPSNVSFEFKQLQFPVMLSFAMAIKKVQWTVLGGGRPKHCKKLFFSYGQLYVECSRAGNPNRLCMLQRATLNIEALHNLIIINHQSFQSYTASILSCSLPSSNSALKLPYHYNQLIA